MNILRLAGATLATFLLSASGFAQSLTSANPAAAGFSAERLARIAPWYQSQIATGALPGAVVAIARNGQLAYLQAIGTYDRAGQIPLKPDAIFWIASMTKPVTSVAAMMLVEEGKLALTDPVAKYIPAVADMRVGLDRAPQKRPMQVVDLLRHTSGFTHSDEAPDELHRAYDTIGSYRRDKTIAELVGDFTRMRLVHQPGEAWEYGHSVDVLGRVVEVASGQPLDQFLESRIFKPLGMVDTGFFVPPDKLARLVDPLATGRPRVWDITKPTTLFMGGGGLASTAPDYLRFCQMLLNGGELDGKRYLSPETFAAMTTDHIGAGSGVERDYFYFPGDGFGFGYGFGIRTDPGKAVPPPPGSIGEIKWDGASGTYFVVDRANDMFFILLENSPSERTRIQPALKRIIYDALGK